MKRRSEGLLLIPLVAMLCLGAATRLASDETLVVFDTIANRTAEGRWAVPVHAWVYEPADSRVRKAALAALIEGRFGLEVTEASRANFDRRANLFFADNERGKEIGIAIADRIATLSPSEASGHVHAELTLPSRPPGFLEIRATEVTAGSRAFKARALLLPPTGLSVISDIDDTVKITEVTDFTALVRNTFFRDFRAVPEMAALYRDWADAGAHFHFVSSSPWQLYSPLTTFLAREGFPPATLHLKHVRLKDETLLDLFAPGNETKPRQIEPLLQRFPSRRFVLVGDSGEQDPEVYAEMLRRYPKQILGVFIRNVTKARIDDARFQRLTRALPEERFVLFDDPRQLVLPAANPVDLDGDSGRIRPDAAID